MNLIFCDFIQFTTQEPVDVQSNHDLGPCDEENYGRRELNKGSDGNETALICSKDNGVYSWKEDAMETESTIVSVLSYLNVCIAIIQNKFWFVKSTIYFAKLIY